MGKMGILLISGHGAGDPGALGNGYKEEKLTRELVNLIAPKLRAYAEVDVYNQTKNAFKDAKNGKLNIAHYDYVLEVHFNSSANKNATGTECYVTSTEKGITVEQAIMRNMSKFFKLRDNDNIFDGVKRENFLVIRTCKKKGISGALLETCFISNKSDMDTYQAQKAKIAQNIADGIAEGFGLKKGSVNTGKPATPAKPKPPKPATQKKTIEQVAHEVAEGKWGNNPERKKKLIKAGYNYNAVQKRVNQLVKKR